jgi:hypothetical protein
VIEQHEVIVSLACAVVYKIRSLSDRHVDVGDSVCDSISVAWAVGFMLLIVGVVISGFRLAYLTSQRARP